MIYLHSNLPVAECRQRLLQAVSDNELTEQLITGIVNGDGTFWLEHIPHQPANFKQRYFSEQFTGEMHTAVDKTEIKGEFSGDSLYLAAIYLLAIVLSAFACGLLVTAVRSLNPVNFIIPLGMVAFVVYWLYSSRGLSEPGQQAILQFLEEALEAELVEDEKPV